MAKKRMNRHDKELEAAKAGIRAQHQRILEAFQDPAVEELLIGLGKDPVKSKKDLRITVGPEVEFNTIAGERAAHRRFHQILLRQMEKGEGVSNNDKNDEFMPKKARKSALSKAFAVRLKNVKNVKIDAEPNTRIHVGTDSTIIEDPVTDARIRKEQLIAFSTKEIVSPPRSLFGVSEWFSRVMQKVVDEYPDYDLQGISFQSKAHQEVGATGIHLNGVIWVGEENVFEKEFFEPGKGIDERSGEHLLSELALLVGHASNEFLKEMLYLFAPTEGAYERYREESLSGPEFVGFRRRKTEGSFPSAMWRGGGRIGSRRSSQQSEDELASAAGPLRYELRVVAPEAAGHPNKKKYPNQKAFPYRMIEAYMTILADGVEMWRDRVNSKGNKKQLSEEALNKEHLTAGGKVKAQYRLPTDKEVAKNRFFKSRRAKLLYGEKLTATKTRMDVIEAQGEELDLVYKERRKPRREELTAHLQRKEGRDEGGRGSKSR